MLIDRFLPRFDVTEVHEVEVDAPPEITYEAIRQTDLATRSLRRCSPCASCRADWASGSAAFPPAAARAYFGRYWTIIRIGVAIVMARALRRIKAEAERRVAAPFAGV
jgi:hypothetical protein